MKVDRKCYFPGPHSSLYASNSPQGGILPLLRTLLLQENSLGFQDCLMVGIFSDISCEHVALSQFRHVSWGWALLSLLKFMHIINMEQHLSAAPLHEKLTRRHPGWQSITFPKFCHHLEPCHPLCEPTTWHRAGALPVAWQQSTAWGKEISQMTAEVLPTNVIMTKYTHYCNTVHLMALRIPTSSDTCK